MFFVIKFIASIAIGYPAYAIMREAGISLWQQIWVAVLLTLSFIVQTLKKEDLL